MFGKLFSQLYTGSMVGAGMNVFAVWPYVIANMVPDKTVGTLVELNPRLLAAVIGADEVAIVDAIHYLCQPDDNSRTEKSDGRRLIKIGQFSYQVVNGSKYRAIRDEETRRAQNCKAQQKHRSKKKLGKAESIAQTMQAAGATPEEIQRAIDNLPPGKFPPNLQTPPPPA